MIAYIVTGILLFMGGISNAQAQTTAGKIVKYHATINDVKYVYGVAEPVARLKSGDILETNTVDAFGNAIQKPGDTISLFHSFVVLTDVLAERFDFIQQGL